jgi:diguanylate cyclase (GGDEF)-like protein
MASGREHIVVIDDSHLILYAIKEILSPFYEVHCYLDHIEGLKAVRQYQPSLILVDIVMPKASGFDVISQLKLNPDTEDIPVIMMTTPRSDDDQGEERSFRMGAVDFIPKPFKPSVVVARVRAHVNLFKYQRELENITITDALTGIYNRRGFNDMLTREWRRSVREGSPLSLLMIDIDHFKNFNDHYGHQYGDNVLSMVAQSIKNALLRATDLATRYGDEEFAVILPGVDERGASVVAENINAAVRNLAILHEHSSAADTVTVSIGVATASKDMPEPEALLRVADKALYKAKANGRNCYYQFKGGQLP